MKKALLIFTLFASINVYAQKDTWKEFQKDNFSIKYPSGWLLKDYENLTFLALAPLESKDDKFQENVNLLIQDLTGMNLDLDSYTTLSLRQLSTQMKNSKVLENKRIKNTPRPYQKIVYTGEMNGFQFKWMQYYWVIGNKAYLVTLTTEESKFKQYEQTGMKIMNSFKITD